jgi:hypothetical protein
LGHAAHYPVVPILPTGTRDWLENGPGPSAGAAFCDGVCLGVCLGDCSTSRTTNRNRLLSLFRSSRRWPCAPNKTDSLDPAALLAPILNDVLALAVRVDLLNAHRPGTVDARYKRGQRSLVVIHWRTT